MYLCKHRHIGPFLTGAQFTTVSAPGATIDKGENDFTTVARTSAGLVLATQAETGRFARGPIVIGTPGADVAAGGFAAYGTVPASGAFNMSLFDASGVADDGTGYFLGFGWEDSDTNRYDNDQKVRASWKDPQILAWRVTNNGTAAIASGGSQASIARASTGLVTLTFTPGRALARTVVAIPVDASARAAQVTAFDGNSVTVKITDVTGTVQDGDFIVVALFSGLHQESGRARDLLRVPQRELEIVAGRIVTTAGTPALTIGAATSNVDVAVTDNGVGDYSITVPDAFGRALIAVGTAKSNRCQLLLTPTTTVARFGVFNAAGAAADDDVDFLILGYNATTAEEF